MADQVFTEQEQSRKLRTAPTTRAVPHLDVKILTEKTYRTEEEGDKSWPSEVDYDAVKAPMVSRSSESNDDDKWMDVYELLPEG